MDNNQPLKRSKARLAVSIIAALIPIILLVGIAIWLLRKPAPQTGRLLPPPGKQVAGKGTPAKQLPAPRGPLVKGAAAKSKTKVSTQLNLQLWEGSGQRQDLVIQAMIQHNQTWHGSIDHLLGLREMRIERAPTSIPYLELMDSALQVRDPLYWMFSDQIPEAFLNLTSSSNLSALSTTLSTGRMMPPLFYSFGGTL
jgi:hypothetical protein